MPSKNIVAIGGGGFGRSLGSLEIEKYIVSLSNKKRPKICFIPTASGDSSLYKLNFYRAFCKLDCITCLLYTSPSPRDRQKSRMPSSA